MVIANVQKDTSHERHTLCIGPKNRQKKRGVGVFYLLEFLSNFTFVIGNREEKCMESRIRAINQSIDSMGSCFSASINSTRNGSLLDGNNFSKLFHLKPVDSPLPDLETEKLLESAEDMLCKSNSVSGKRMCVIICLGFFLLAVALIFT